MRGADWQEANGSWLRRLLNWNLCTNFFSFLLIAAAFGLLIAVVLKSNDNTSRLQNLDEVVEHRMQRWCASKNGDVVVEQLSALQAYDFSTYLDKFSANATLYFHDSILPQGGAWTGLDFSNYRSIPWFFFTLGCFVDVEQITLNTRDLHNCGSDTFEFEMAIEMQAFCPWNSNTHMPGPYDATVVVVSKLDWQHKIVRQDWYMDSSAIAVFLVQQCQITLPLAASSLPRPASAVNGTAAGGGGHLPWEPRS